MSGIDWKRVYDAFDGGMKDCLGGQCSKPCCNTKFTSTWDSGRQPYNTALDPGELEFQLSAFGSLPEGIGTQLVDANIDRGAPHMRVLLRGCLAADGTCRMGVRKPAACRIFPLDSSPLLPLRNACPQAGAIALDPAAQQGIIAVREAFYFSSCRNSSI